MKNNMSSFSLIRFLALFLTLSTVQSLCAGDGAVAVADGGADSISAASSVALAEPNFSDPILQARVYQTFAKLPHPQQHLLRSICSLPRNITRTDGIGVDMNMGTMYALAPFGDAFNMLPMQIHKLYAELSSVFPEDQFKAQHDAISRLISVQLNCLTPIYIEYLGKLIPLMNGIWVLLQETASLDVSGVEQILGEGIPPIGAAFTLAGQICILQATERCPLSVKYTLDGEENEDVLKARRCRNQWRYLTILGCAIDTAASNIAPALSPQGTPQATSFGVDFIPVDSVVIPCEELEAEMDIPDVSQDFSNPRVQANLAEAFERLNQVQQDLFWMLSQMPERLIIQEPLNKNAALGPLFSFETFGDALSRSRNYMCRISAKIHEASAEDREAYEGLTRLTTDCRKRLEGNYKLYLKLVIDIFSKNYALILEELAKKDDHSFLEISASFNAQFAEAGKDFVTTSNTTVRGYTERQIGHAESGAQAGMRTETCESHFLLLNALGYAVDEMGLVTSPEKQAVDFDDDDEGDGQGVHNNSLASSAATTPRGAVVSFAGGGAVVSPVLTPRGVVVSFAAVPILKNSAQVAASVFSTPRRNAHERGDSGFLPSAASASSTPRQGAFVFPQRAVVVAKNAGAASAVFSASRQGASVSPQRVVARKVPPQRQVLIQRQIDAVKKAREVAAEKKKEAEKK